MLTDGTPSCKFFRLLSRDTLSSGVKERFCIVFLILFSRFRPLNTRLCQAIFTLTEIFDRAGKEVLGERHKVKKTSRAFAGQFLSVIRIFKKDRVNGARCRGFRARLFFADDFLFLRNPSLMNCTPDTLRRSAREIPHFELTQESLDLSVRRAPSVRTSSPVKASVSETVLRDSTAAIGISLEPEYHPEIDLTPEPYFSIAADHLKALEASEPPEAQKSVRRKPAKKDPLK